MSRGGEEGPLAIVCGGGILPFVVADAVARRGRQAVLFALREFADDSRVVGYRHHWISFGQVGAFLGLLRKECCRELVFIGSVVRPPPIRGSTGDSRAISAKRLKKLSSGPNTIDGLRMTASLRVSWTALSPRALLRA